MIHAGMGEQQINKFLTTINLPAVHQKTIKRLERKVAPVIEELAADSVNQSTMEEEAATQEL